MEEHFRRRLAAAEACKPPLGNVRWQQCAPASPDELDLLRRNSGYEGEPVLLSAESWCPDWSNVLGAADISQGIQEFLQNAVEVETCKLRYRSFSDGTPLNTAVERSSIDAATDEHDDIRPIWDPVPVTENEIMDFASFVRQARHLLLEPKNELLYLTWRALPESAKTLEGTSISEEFDFFLENLLLPTTTPAFVRKEAIQQRNMWMGSIITSRIHFDALDNLHVCLSGKKVFHLYSPSELRNLYPCPWKEGSLNNFSSVESILSVKPGAHDRYMNNANYLRAEVSEGQAIYIPAGWWHEVFTMWGFTVSANAWFDRTPEAQFRPTLMHLKSESFYKFMVQRQTTESYHI